MKLLTCVHDGKTVSGFLDGGDVVICAEGDAAERAVLAAIEGGAAALKAWGEQRDTARRVALNDVRMLAPIPRPVRDIFCVGKNYRAHAAEFHGSGFDSSAKEEVPSAPVIFTKATTSVCGPGDPVMGSLDPTNTVDYEGELAVVIGQRAFQVPAEKAFDVVFGYTIVNDVTSRELQKKHNQWVIGKGLDTFCPMGPFISTADEIGDLDSLGIVTEINGEVRQNAVLGDLIFDIPTLIETLTRTMTLLPGDIIATGTPEGVGIGFKPPKYLAKGDVMRVTIDGLGVLENPIA